MPDTLNTKIAKNIKDLRLLKGYKQQHVADLLKINQADYSEIENGLKKINLELVDEIAKVLEITPEGLLNFDKTLIFTNNNCNINGQGSNLVIHIHKKNKDKSKADE